MRHHRRPHQSAGQGPRRRPCARPRGPGGVPLPRTARDARPTNGTRRRGCTHCSRRSSAITTHDDGEAFALAVSEGGCRVDETADGRVRVGGPPARCVDRTGSARSADALAPSRTNGVDGGCSVDRHEDSSGVSPVHQRPPPGTSSADEGGCTLALSPLRECAVLSGGGSLIDRPFRGSPFARGLRLGPALAVGVAPRPASLGHCGSRRSPSLWSDTRPSLSSEGAGRPPIPRASVCQFDAFAFSAGVAPSRSGSWPTVGHDTIIAHRVLVGQVKYVFCA